MVVQCLFQIAGSLLTSSSTSLTIEASFNCNCLQASVSVASMQYVSSVVAGSLYVTKTTELLTIFPQHHTRIEHDVRISLENRAIQRLLTAVAGDGQAAVKTSRNA